MENDKIYNIRYIARFTIEAATPLKVGTGNKGITVDEVVATDVNGLPYIPGTSLAGVLRNAYQGSNTNDIFGKENGARLAISSAYMVGKEGKVIQGIAPRSTFDNNPDFYNNYKTLALRDHVRIGHKGATDAKKRGKFDSQVVFKGTRFVFEIELIGDGSKDDNQSWEELIETIKKPEFRLGGGTRKGFGDVSLISIEEKQFKLNGEDKEDLDAYLEKGPSFNTSFGNTTDLRKEPKTTSKSSTHYQLNLSPDYFFIFSDGAGENDIDSVQKKEKVVKWKEVVEKDENEVVVMDDNNNPKKIEKPYFTKEQILIPATSVKGAIAHRTAFYYNKLNEVYADEVNNLSEHIGQKNEAVKVLFGFETNDKNGEDKKGRRGRVIISDIFEKQEKVSTKLLNHVAIDRFTGGAIDGALFNEQVVSTNEFALNIYVEKADELEADKTIRKAFELALKDVCTGMLPLGGSVMRGHGCFKGKIKRDGKTLNLEDINND